MVMKAQGLMEGKMIGEFALLEKAKTIIESFIRSCSHNLKSPLSSIEGLVILAGYSNNQAEVKQYLQLIQKSTANLVDMIHSLEEYTTIQKCKLEADEIEASELVERVVSEQCEEIEKQNIAVSTTVVQPMKWINDKRSVYVILRNLLRNAIQFSNKNAAVKSIEVKIEVEAANVSMEVTDNGVGISKKEQARIFEPFHRGSELSVGNGLGLFLVKAFIDRLKASMAVHSVENVGTTFFISIPNNLAI